MCFDLSESIILFDDILEYIKPYIHDPIGNVSFHKWFDLLFAIDEAFIERDLTKVTEYLNESLPILRELAFHVKDQQISVLLLHTSNECEDLIEKLYSKHANFKEIYLFLSQTASSFIGLLRY